MAVAGSAIPSMQVRINRGKLEVLGSQLMQPAAVQTDMVLAAEALRRWPTKSIRIDAKRFRDLQAYLKNSGDVE